MIRSMTGYGKAEIQGSDARYCVEIKTVNHRYADISIKLPRALLFVERIIKKQAATLITRGKIDIFVTRETTEEATLTPVVNDALATEYVRLFNELSCKHKLDGDIPIQLLVSQKDVITLRETDIDEDVVRDHLLQTLAAAVSEVNKMRLAEGEELQRDMQVRIDSIENMLHIIEERAPQVVSEWHEKLTTRLNRLQESVEVDPQRVAQEIAIFADRCDISEEIVRFKSHLVQFRRLFATDEAVGRQMDFLLQELNRETNTMGSKSNDAQLTSTVVSIKAELEKIREQVQNIE